MATGDPWRVLDFETHDCYMNMAIDEALIKLNAENRSPNTLRFYRWKPSAVSIGFFQSVKEEVDTNRCKSLGVDLVRRITGGGAVYHDYNGEVTYSLIVDEEDHRIPSKISDCYQVLCGALVAGLGRLGLSGEFHPINDILVNGKKISGNAQTRRMGVVLQHGTVLVEANLRRMFSLLKVGEEKIRDKMIAAAEERVTSIKRELGSGVAFEAVADALMNGFRESLDVEFESQPLMSNEVDLARKLREEKYSSREWINRR